MKASLMSLMGSNSSRNFVPTAGAAAAGRHGYWLVGSLVGGLIEMILDVRARKDRDWALTVGTDGSGSCLVRSTDEADELRDRLKELGVEVEDGKDGVKWKLI